MGQSFVAFSEYLNFTGPCGGLTEPIVIHYLQVMAGTSTMNGDPIFQGATVSLTDIMFGSSHATPPCGELNLLDAALFRLTLPRQAPPALSPPPCRQCSVWDLYSRGSPSKERCVICKSQVLLSRSYVVNLIIF